MEGVAMSESVKTEQSPESLSGQKDLRLSPAALEHPEQKEGWGGWLLRTVPSGLVLAALLGVAYWGHHTGWTFTSGGQGRPDGDDPEANRTVWAEGPEPGAADRAWCAEHGVLGCPLSHPELAQLPRGPVITAQDRERVRQALAVRPRPVNDPACARLPHRVRFASRDEVERMGIEVSPAWETSITETITASGEVAFDPAQVAHLSARAPGTAWRVTKKLGDAVRAGEVLAVIDAAEVGKAKAEFLQALVQVRLRTQALASARNAPVSAQQKREAEAALRDAEVRLRSAEQTLVNLDLPVREADFQGLGVAAIADRLQRVGLTDDLLRGLDPATSSGNLLPVRAPFAGVVLNADVIAGEAVDTTRVLFVLANPERMWLTLHVAPDEAPWLKVGQPVQFRPDGTTDEFSGKLTGIGKAADEKTRRVPVRAELANKKGHLRAFTFGLGKVVLREEPKGVLVPSAAVQSDGRCRFVFVRDKDFLKPDGPKVFHARAVRVGTQDGPNTEIIVGVLPGEVVAVKGSSLLLNEVRRNRTETTRR
jgi:cobalt-zinc-cadmium efflux system membrane fusion protein